MGRGHGKISTGFWNDPRVRSLPEDGRSLLVYLFTSPHSTAAGCYVLPIAYAARDLQWDIERVSKGFGILSQKPFVLRDDVTDIVHIPGWWDENKPENPNVATHVVALFRSLPECRIKNNAINALRDFASFKPTVTEVFRKAYPNPLETLPETVRIPEPEPEPDIPPSEDAGASKGGASIVIPLKEQIFSIGLAWLTAKASIADKQARSLLGKWLRDHGEANTLEALFTAQRNCPPDPVPYITRILKPKATHAKPTPDEAFAAQLAGLKNALSPREVDPDRPGPSGQIRVIERDRSPGKPDETGDRSGIRPGDRKADRVRGGVSNPMPETGRGARDLPGTTWPVAGGPSGPWDRSDQGGMGLGQPDAVPGGYPEQGQGRLEQAIDVAGSSEGGAPEGDRTNRGETGSRTSADAARTSAHPTDRFPELPAFLDRRPGRVA